METAGGEIRNNSPTAATLSTYGGDYAGNLLNGSSAALALTMNGSGQLTLSGSNSHSGVTRINGGLWNGGILFEGANALSANSNLRITNGVAGFTGDFTRSIGTGAGQVRFDDNGYAGFAAFGTDFTVNIGGAETPATLTRGSNFLGSNGALTFGHDYGSGTVTFANPVNLNGSRLYLAAAEVYDDKNPLVAIMSGVLSNGTGLEVYNPGSNGGVYSERYDVGFIRLAADNTFNGPVFIEKAGIEIDRIGNIGSGAGPLGMASNLANSRILLDRGALRYTGTGHSTDRSILLDNNASTTAAAIVAEGSGALKLTGDIDAIANKGGLLVLAGSSIAQNEIAGTIWAVGSGANAVFMDLEKQDAGTWVLSGTSYVESLAVYGGLLDIKGYTFVSGTTPVTVAGGTLRIGQASLVASGFSVESGGTLQYANPGTFLDALPISVVGTSSNRGTIQALSGTTTRTAVVNLPDFSYYEPYWEEYVQTTSVYASIQAEERASLIFDTATGSAITLSGSAAYGNLTFGGGGSITVNDNINLAYGDLYYTGTGVLTLAAANTYSRTNISSGQVIATANGALGTGTVTISNFGTLLIAEGTSIFNAVRISGATATYARQLASGASLVGALNSTSQFTGGNPDTTAKLLAGTTSATATLETGFATASAAFNDDIRLSDIFHLSGVPVADAETGATDIFTLQLSMASMEPDSILGWLNQNNLWVNATEGNFGEGILAGSYTISWGEFQTAYLGEGALANALGAYGVDTATRTVWAVLNHNSEFSIVPEPGVCTLVSLGVGALLLFRRRRA